MKITIEGLLDFVKSQEITYASRVGANAKKKLIFNGKGEFKVYHNGEHLKTTEEADEAVKLFNVLTPLD